MEKRHIRPLPTRRASLSLRSDLRGSLSLLLDNHRQSNMSQVSSRTQANDHNEKFYSELYPSNYEGIRGKPRGFMETPGKKQEDSAIYGSLKEFSDDFTSLLNDPVFSDVELKCDNEIMKAHKNILAARSPVFNAMFSISMVESATGVVVIDDLDPQTVRDLLTFIYCNKVQNLSLMKACGLLEASTKYQIPTLKDLCVGYLISILTRENAIFILQKADLHDFKLKRRVINFVSEMFFDLRRTEEWTVMQTNNPVLALEVCNLVIDKLAEKH